MYTAVPKDASGSLGHAAVRYVLHRFFAQKYGWFIRGLEPRNDTTIRALAPESVIEADLQNLQEWVPGYLQKFIEEMQGGRDLDLLQLAVLAATLEDIIHKESNQHLQMAFTGLELPFSTLLNETQIQEVLEVYMMIHTLGGDFGVQGREPMLQARKAFSDQVTGWGRVQQWLQSQLEIASSSIETPLDFIDASRVAQMVAGNYGKYRDTECGTLKSELLQIESTKAGRVRLADFYKKGLGGNFEFTEKVEYLHALGAIDASNTSEPYVIIPNYVASRSNCETVSDFYLVCCRSECEDLLASLDKEFQKPTASPAQILEVVSSFSTKTIAGPRMLADTLVQRLESVAAANRGQVPLHGRLFAQWMHHAFPRECPYPQKMGDVAAMTADEWMHATGHEDTQHTHEEMQVIVDSHSRIVHPVGEKAHKHHNLVENELPWDEIEELLYPDSANNVVHLHAATPKAPRRSLFDKAALVFFILGAVAFAWKMARGMKGSSWRDGLMV